MKTYYISIVSAEDVFKGAAYIESDSKKSAQVKCEDLKFSIPEDDLLIIECPETEDVQEEIARFGHNRLISKVELLGDGGKSLSELDNFTVDLIEKDSLKP